MGICYCPSGQGNCATCREEQAKAKAGDRAPDPATGTMTFHPVDMGSVIPPQASRGSSPKEAAVYARVSQYVGYVMNSIIHDAIAAEIKTAIGGGFVISDCSHGETLRGCTIHQGSGRLLVIRLMCDEDIKAGRFPASAPVVAPMPQPNSDAVYNAHARALLGDAAAGLLGKDRPTSPVLAPMTVVIDPLSKRMEEQHVISAGMMEVPWDEGSFLTVGKVVAMLKLSEWADDEMSILNHAVAGEMNRRRSGQ